MNRYLQPAFAGIAPFARQRVAGHAAATCAAVIPAVARPIARDRRCVRYRMNVGARVIAGTFGSYAVVATLGALLARALPIARAEAVMTATLVALLLFPAVTLWAFLTRSPGRACFGVFALATAFGIAAAVLPPPA